MMPVGNIDGFAKAIKTILENRSLNERMSFTALQRARKEFSYQQHNGILEKSLLSLLI